MTLVAARVREGVISAVSEAGVTRNAETFGPVRGVPKLCILSPDLAVGFAGGIDNAVSALTGFDEGASRRPTEYFLSAHREVNGATDFLLLRGSPPSIIKISNGRADPPVRRAGSASTTDFLSSKRR